MDLAHLQKPTPLGSALEALSKVEFPAAYAVTVIFEHLPAADETLNHAYASGDIARFVQAIETESIAPIRQRAGWKLRFLIFSEKSAELMLRFHILVDNPSEYSEAQVRLALVRSQRAFRLPGVSVSPPVWESGWQRFVVDLVDREPDAISYEFQLSQLYGVE